MEQDEEEESRVVAEQVEEALVAEALWTSILRSRRLPLQVDATSPQRLRQAVVLFAAKMLVLLAAAAC